jgi:alpha-tubulin suppressor-like RCC1 family protein
LTNEAEVKRAELETLLREKFLRDLHSTVFACGENTNNRLGINGNKNQRKFVQTSFGVVKTVDANYETCGIDPTLQLWINGVKHLEGKMIKRATSGWTAHYAVDGDDKLWSWGESNSSGQLGNGTTNACATPKMIEALKNESIKQIEVYGDRVACVTTNNDCYVWGQYSDAFGFGEKVTTPTKLDRRVEQISLGYDQALMIASNCVYSIGANSFGQLGVGDFNDRAKWTKIDGLEGETIQMVQCGFYCSAILTDKFVYIMGKYLNGAADNKVNVPTKVKLSNITKISLKGTHILAINDAGTVFSWGYNYYGQCGVDSSTNQITEPTRVPIPDNFTVVDISAGCWHSAIKCCKK